MSLAMCVTPGVLGCARAAKSSEAVAAEQSFFSVLVSLAGLAPPKMGPSELLLILVPFILLESVQKPGLVKGFMLSKYWGLSPSSGGMELGWGEGIKNLTDEECFPPPHPGILGGRGGDPVCPLPPGKMLLVKAGS